MNKQAGFSLSEVLISLFLASIIMTTIMQLYLSSKGQYSEAEAILQERFDVQWLSDLFADSIRRAGFTPCLGIDQLKVRDMRHAGRVVHGLKIDPSQQSIQINRMSEVFVTVLALQSPTKIRVSSEAVLNINRPILIADCDHAEVHEIMAIKKLVNGSVITLSNPLLFTNTQSVYLGEWLEERWFIKKNPQGNNSLYYQAVQTEELSALVHALHINNQEEQGKQFLEITMALAQDKTYKLRVAVRGS